jgi:hypothetical protein
LRKEPEKHINRLINQSKVDNPRMEAAAVTGDIGNFHIDQAPALPRSFGRPAPDRLGMAAAALDDVMVQAHEAGDLEALRILHALSALLAATRRQPSALSWEHLIG